MAENSTSLRVLVVEDESLIRWSIAETLITAGHTVIEAQDAESAMRAVNETDGPIDVVLLDFRLPDSSDLMLLANIRQATPNSSVLLMTAFGTPEVTQGALDLGAYRVLSKPVDVHDLASLVVEAHQARFA